MLQVEELEGEQVEELELLAAVVAQAREEATGLAVGAVGLEQELVVVLVAGQVLVLEPVQVPAEPQPALALVVVGVVVEVERVVQGQELEEGSVY